MFILIPTGIGDHSDVLQLLQKCEFYSTRWSDLGLSLGLHKSSLEAIKGKHHNNPDCCLSECISHWLLRNDDVDSRGGPTWHSLSDSLRTINEVAVADKLDKESKYFNTIANNSVFFIECPQVLVIRILRSHFPLLSDSLSDPVNTAWLLYQERMITRGVVNKVESASPSIPKQREVLLTAVKEAVLSESNNLQLFACVLCKLSNNVRLGQAIHNDIGKNQF